MIARAEGVPSNAGSEARSLLVYEREFVNFKCRWHSDTLTKSEARVPSGQRRVSLEELERG